MHGGTALHDRDAEFQQEVPLGLAYARLDWNAAGDHTINSQLDPLLRDSYSLINLSAGLHSMHFSVILWGKNITDETHAMVAAEVPLAANTNQHWLNPPLSYGVTLKYNY